MRRAAFLDRDGVLNQTLLVDGVPEPPNSISEVKILNGVLEGIQLLKNSGFIPVVVTNQPDVARGKQSKEIVEAINLYIGTKLQIEHFFTCFHDDLDFCSCRKPAPGLIFQAAAQLQLDIASSFLVGDRWRDISAGQAAGCQSYFIDYSYREKLPDMPYFQVNSLLEATRIAVGEYNGV